MFQPPTQLLLFWLLALAGCTALRADPRINEFMASNGTTLADKEGNFPDWIELYNPDAVAVNLSGWYLTDDAADKKKWQFPAVSLPAGGYLVVFASVEDRRNPAEQLHTNFAIDIEGEYLALIKPDGVAIATEFAPKFPEQQRDVSFGYAPGTPPGNAVYLSTPTPGAPNTPASPTGIAETVAFSVAAGPFQAPFSLSLSGVGIGQQVRYVVAPAASGATTPEPTATSPLYTAPIAISSSSVVRAALFSTDGKVRGATRTVYYSKISPALAGFTGTLPVLIIDSLGSGPLVKDQVDHSAWLQAYIPRSSSTPVFATAPNLVSPLTTTVRGATSADFPKKSYNLKFTNELGRSDSPTLLDLPSQESWALVGPWKFDLSYIKNAFIYALSNQIGRWAPRTRLVEVFFHAGAGDIDLADYVGIYVLTDRIEVGKKRVDLANLRPTEVSGSDVTGGYILKLDSPATDENSWRTSRGYPNNNGSSVILDSPGAGSAAPAQVTYIRDYVQRMEDALFASRNTGWADRTYLDTIDRATWVDHHLLNTLAANPDAFQRSAYFMKNRKDRLAAGPVWDFDRSLGSYWDNRSFRYEVWVGEGASNLWETGWWGVLARDPEFMQDWIDRWQALRETELASPRLGTLIDSLSADLGTAAVRDAARWPDNAGRYGDGTFAAQIDHLKQWVTSRTRWIDEQWVAAPEVSTAGSAMTVTPPENTAVAYTLDGSDPRSLGGALAPNAILTSAPFTVPTSSNLHVRSYDHTRIGVYPGSPWSSAMSGPASSPLSPVARLSNLSSRAVVGAGENALIVGVVVADTETKRYLVRGVGPALAAFGLTGFVPDPQLAVYNSKSIELFRNTSWENGPDATKLPAYAASVGAFVLPSGSLDSALANELPSGAYTVQITTPNARSGVGLAELYELDSSGRTTNLSTRAQVGAGSEVLIGGFVIQGTAFKRILVRAIGPTLESFGVAGALRDPILTIYNGQTVVATNDRWESVSNLAAVNAATQAVGAFKLVSNSADAALLITLPPDAYTVKVSGKNDTTGVALLEVYEVP